MDIAKILVKKIKGPISVDEEKYFDEWLQKSEENKSLFLRLQKLHNNDEDNSDIDDKHIDLAWKNALRTAKANNGKGAKTILLQISKYAAIFIGVFTLGYLYWQTNLPDYEETISEDSITLQLENGKIQQISPEKVQTIVGSKGKVLGVQNGIQLNYHNNTKIDKLTYNVLTVPYGKTFKLILSDSTTVHLNAGSSLKYPVKFINDRNRQVFLTGEGYFDVREDKNRPFIVTNGTMDVRVLGTKFNISAYPEDTQISTVLVEGSVSLYSNTEEYSSETSHLLQPNKMASWNRSNESIVINSVDTDIYTGWINGRLVIKKMPFKNIIQKLQRHYKVTIHNTVEQLDNRIFTASFDTESIEEVLNTFALETPFEYTVNDNLIEISESKK